jgi:hypothetical protein
MHATLRRAQAGLIHAAGGWRQLLLVAALQRLAFAACFSGHVAGLALPGGGPVSAAELGAGLGVTPTVMLFDLVRRDQPAAVKPFSQPARDRSGSSMVRHTARSGWQQSDADGQARRRLRGRGPLGGAARAGRARGPGRARAGAGLVLARRAGGLPRRAAGGVLRRGARLFKVWRVPKAT